MTRLCPHCGFALPACLARVCLSCYARLSAPPDGPPLGVEPPPPRTWLARGGVLLVFAGFLLTFSGIVALVERDGPSIFQFAVAVALTGCALYLGHRQSRLQASTNEQ